MRDRERAGGGRGVFDDDRGAVGGCAHGAAGPGADEGAGAAVGAERADGAHAAAGLEDRVVAHVDVVGGGEGVVVFEAQDGGLILIVARVGADPDIAGPGAVIVFQDQIVVGTPGCVVVGAAGVVRGEQDVAAGEGAVAELAVELDIVLAAAALGCVVDMDLEIVVEGDVPVHLDPAAVGERLEDQAFCLGRVIDHIDVVVQLDDVALDVLAVNIENRLALATVGPEGDRGAGEVARAEDIGLADAVDLALLDHDVAREIRVVGVESECALPVLDERA